MKTNLRKVPLALVLFLFLGMTACQRNAVQPPGVGGTGRNSNAPTATVTAAASPAAVNVTLFTGGDPSPSSTLYSDTKAGVYTTVVLWDGHVGANGDISYNDSSIVASGAWNSNTATNAWLSQVTSLKTGSTITRLEFSFGGEATTFANIESLINEYGTDSTSPLYRSFSVLHTTLGLDAIDFDDESQYDSTSSKAFALMCAGLGMKVSICPYTDDTYWVALINSINRSLPGTVDAIYLQCYSGGAGNSPKTWNGYFSGTGLKVCPGQWAIHNSTCNAGSTATEVEAQLKTWAGQTSLAGAFMYNGNEMEGCPLGGTPAQYATAMKDGL